MRKCPYCKKDVGGIALVNLVYTWEKPARKNELVETVWHKKCYNAQQSAHTQKVHYDKDLSGVTACKRVSYDYAHEDISKVTCKACLRANKTCAGRKASKRVSKSKSVKALRH